MAGKRTLDERIQEKDNLMQQLLTKAKQCEAQILLRFYRYIAKRG